MGEFTPPRNKHLSTRKFEGFIVRRGSKIYLISCSLLPWSLNRVRFLCSFVVVVRHAPSTATTTTTPEYFGAKKQKKRQLLRRRRGANEQRQTAALIFKNVSTGFLLINAIRGQIPIKEYLQNLVERLNKRVLCVFAVVFFCKSELRCVCVFLGVKLTKYKAIQLSSSPTANF